MFRASILIDRQTGDRLRLGRKLSNIGQLYDTMGDREQGLAFVERALDVFEGVDDRAGRCDALSAVAEMMLATGREPQDASMPLDQARRIADRLGSHYEIARERIVRAQLEEARGDREAAIAAAREALESALAEDLVSYELSARSLLAGMLEVADARGHVDEVLTRLESGVQVEHLDRLYERTASALRRLGDESRAIRCEDAARAEVNRQASAIRDADTRRLFIASKRSLFPDGP